jgi:hypothetical protein
VRRTTGSRIDVENVQTHLLLRSQPSRGRISAFHGVVHACGAEEVPILNLYVFESSGILKLVLVRVRSPNVPQLHAFAMLEHITAL